MCTSIIPACSSGQPKKKLAEKHIVQPLKRLQTRVVNFRSIRQRAAKVSTSHLLCHRYKTCNKRTVLIESLQRFRFAATVKVRILCHSCVSTVPRHQRKSLTAEIWRNYYNLTVHLPCQLLINKCQTSSTIYLYGSTGCTKWILIFIHSPHYKCQNTLSQAIQKLFIILFYSKSTLRYLRRTKLFRQKLQTIRPAFETMTSTYKQTWRGVRVYVLITIWKTSVKIALKPFAEYSAFSKDLWKICKN